MVVEAQEEVVMESRDQSQVVIRGKRTKRQRPLSPVPVPITTDGWIGFKETGFVTDMRSSPGSSGEIRTNSCTEEEEETANCLILLARGQSLVANNNDNENSIVETRKFNSRKFLETDSIKGNGKAGCYVYECKTCNRVFPSFQALGGHRASHKRPRTANNSCATTDEIKKISNKNFMDQNEDHHHHHNQHLEAGRYKNINNSPFSLQLSYSSFTRGGYSSNIGNKGNKVHECGICGAEFNSGQALGGHMRRHRGSTTPALSMAITDSDNNQNQDLQLKKGRNFSLDLDLNLPAPDGDNLELLDSSSSQFFVSKQQERNQHKQQQQQQEQQEELNQQQTSLVLSAPTLVDCHY